MLINKAYAQAVDTIADGAAAAPEAPNAMEAFIWNIGLVGVMVFLFYILLIRPQQKRFKEHSQMLQGLKKGDKVITGGGLVGKIEKIKDGENEVTVDLGGGVKVTAMRATLQNHSAPMPGTAANDASKAKETKTKK